MAPQGTQAQGMASFRASFVQVQEAECLVTSSSGWEGAAKVFIDITLLSWGIKLFMGACLLREGLL